MVTASAARIIGGAKAMRVNNKSKSFFISMYV